MKRLHKISSALLVVILAFTALPVGGVMAEDPTDTQGPLTSAVAVTPDLVSLNETVMVSAAVDDSTTGGSIIKSAEYSLNGGLWIAMSASDGVFDTVSEGVAATFTATQIGQNEVCVRGMDVADNVGDAVCAYFGVQYTFKGFFPPIRMGKDNKARAGRTIPVKWQLTAGGNPISDKASFVALKSYAVDCQSLVGDPASAVVESASGKSGLRYQGEGYWRFNWKSSKNYRSSCRMMFVLFNDGQMSPEVLFRFK